MTRYIFPSGGVAAYWPRSLRFFRTVTATRPQTDLTEVDNEVDTAPIPNGIVVTSEDGSYRSFCGPDDLTSLWVEVDATGSRFRINAVSATRYTDGSWTPGAGGGSTIGPGLTIPFTIGSS